MQLRQWDDRRDRSVGKTRTPLPTLLRASSAGVKNNSTCATKISQYGAQL
jgi:hypothetical protein